MAKIYIGTLLFYYTIVDRKKVEFIYKCKCIKKNLYDEKKTIIILLHKKKEIVCIILSGWLHLAYNLHHLTFIIVIQIIVKNIYKILTL